jgi:hypothetical protein
MSTIKSFKGRLLDGAQERIYLAGGDSDKGFKIHKLQVMPSQPFNRTQESVVKVYLEEQSSVDGAVNFRDDTLLAVAIFKQNDSTTYFAYEQVLFDNKVINQDLYVTCYDAATGEEMNYYIELEEVKMSGSEQAVVNFNAALLHAE